MFACVHVSVYSYNIIRRLVSVYSTVYCVPKHFMKDDDMKQFILSILSRWRMDPGEAGGESISEMGNVTTQRGAGES